MNVTTVNERALEMPYELADSQIRDFREQGFIKLKNVFSLELLEYYGGEITRITMAKNPLANIPLDQRDTYGKAFIQVGNIWQHSEIAREFTFSIRLARIAAQLLELPSVRLWHDQALYKESGGGITPWHVDQQYWPMLTDRTVTAWIPLQSIPPEMGPLRFGAKSHRMNIARNLEISDLSEQLISDAVSKYHVEEVCEPFEIGEVSFHLGWTLHSAGANKSGLPRKVHTVIYMDSAQRLAEPANRFQQADWESWTPSTKIGEVMDDECNPVLY